MRTLRAHGSPREPADPSGMSLQLVERALELASVLNGDGMRVDRSSWSVFTRDLEDALIALDRPIGRTKAGQRYVALLAIHEEVEKLWPQWEQYQQWGNAACDNPAYALLRRVAAAFSSGLPESLTRSVFELSQTEEPSECAAAVFRTWRGRGKWSAVNGLLSVWHLAVREPNGPRISAQHHPLADEWKKLKRRPPRGSPQPAARTPRA
ncbi:MAG: hypothetical protein JW940_12645 [Polyangiaceae bacterium]|nr:hypothetical protein [Polyangiaceae bacterium]